MTTYCLRKFDDMDSVAAAALYDVSRPRTEIVHDVIHPNVHLYEHRGNDVVLINHTFQPNNLLQLCKTAKSVTVIGIKHQQLVELREQCTMEKRIPKNLKIYYCGEGTATGTVASEIIRNPKKIPALQYFKDHGLFSEWHLDDSDFCVLVWSLGGEIYDFFELFSYNKEKLRKAMDI